MTTTLVPALPAPVATARVDVVLPVFNEERALPGSLQRLHAFLTQSFPCAWRIVVADNASTDRTPLVARTLAARLERDWRDYRTAHPTG